jgi:hypothetical protein
VIPLFPAMSGVQTCWDCVWHTDVVDEKGAVSYCSLFAEDIHDEGQAEDCDAWDPHE